MFNYEFRYSSRLLAATLIAFQAVSAFAQPAAKKGGKAATRRRLSPSRKAFWRRLWRRKSWSASRSESFAAARHGHQALRLRVEGIQSVPDENTSFHIQSLSKGIIAVGAVILVDEGKLKLDAPAGRYVKDLPESWQRVTIAQRW